MASPKLVGPHCGNRNIAHRALEDFQDIFADILEDARFHESKQLMGSRVADLMQAKTAVLSSAAEAHLQNVKQEHSDRLQHLQLEVADKECQLVAARADTDHWKRRAGVLFLKMSSVQEDADMYSMRCKLLEAEVTRESQHTRSLKSKAVSLYQTLAACQQQLLESQHAGQVLQAQLDTASQDSRELLRLVSSLRAELEDGKQAAAAHAKSAAGKLAEAQAEHERAGAQAAAAGKAAEAAEKRCEELQWRLQQQDAALAQRARLAEEARAATEGLSKEGIQAVREKASFLERELREQVAAAHEFMEEERRQRRAAEASLARQLAEARADASALRACLATAGDTQQQQEARQALDVVSSLVQDLAPPDTAARPPRPSDAGNSSSRAAQLQRGTTASEQTGRAPKAGISDAEPEAMEVEKPRGRKKRKAAGKQAAAKAAVQAVELPSEHSGPHKSALQAVQGNLAGDAAMSQVADLQTVTVGEDSIVSYEPEDPRAARRKTRATQQQSQATATMETAGESADVEVPPVAGERKLGEPELTSGHAGPQRPHNSRASSQTQAISEDTAAAADNEQSGASEQAAQAGKHVAAAKQIGKWDKQRPAGVSKLDLTTVWGNAKTPPASLGDKSAAEGGPNHKENPAQAEPQAPALGGIIKPLPGRSRFNTAMEANPLAAVNLRVLEAAGALRPNYVSGLTAPKRPSNGAQAPAGKRKLLPAPKPLGAVGALPQDVLFGQGFKAPKLSRQ